MHINHPMDDDPHATPHRLDFCLAGVSFHVQSNSRVAIDHLAARYAPALRATAVPDIRMVLRHGATTSRPTNNACVISRSARTIRGNYQESPLSRSTRLVFDRRGSISAVVTRDRCDISGELVRNKHRLGDYVDMMITEYFSDRGFTLAWGHGIIRDGMGVVIAGPPGSGVDLVATALLRTGNRLISGTPLVLGSGPFGPLMIGSSDQLHLSPSAIMATPQLRRWTTSRQMLQFSNLSDTDAMRRLTRLAGVPPLHDGALRRAILHPVDVVILLRWSQHDPLATRIRPAVAQERRAMLEPFGHTAATLATVVAEGRLDIPQLVNTMNTLQAPPKTSWRAPVCQSDLLLH